MGRPHQGNIFGYNGEHYNSVTGYQFLRARYYGTQFARFLTRDTFLGWEDDPLSLNRYSYVHNDPINLIDPTGHWAQQQIMCPGGGNTVLTADNWRTVQRRLNWLNYRGVDNRPVPVNGRNDQHTSSALSRFRRVNGTTSGAGGLRRGDQTWNRLINNSPREALAKDVALTQAQWRQVQNRLNNLNYRGVDNRPMPVNGRSDQHTTSALSRFRHINGTTSPSGSLRVGDSTWHRLINHSPTRARENQTSSSSSQQSSQSQAPRSAAASGSNQTSNQRNSNTAQAQTPTYEPPTYIRVLGIRIRVPAWLVNLFGSSSGSQSTRSLSGEDGYVGIGSLDAATLGGSLSPDVLGAILSLGAIIISAIPAWLLPAIAIAGVVAVVGTVLDMGRNLRDLLDIELRFLRGFKATGAVAASSAWAGLGAGGGIIGGGVLRPGPGVGNNGGALGGNDIILGGAVAGAIIGTVMTLSQAKDLLRERSRRNDPTFIFRMGSGNGRNLTPRPNIDWDGLSYQLTPPIGSFTITAMELVNATGVLSAREDRPRHVAVMPVPATRMTEWMASAPPPPNNLVNINPHELTRTLMSISIRVG